MYRFFESIRIADGIAQHAPYHFSRMCRAVGMKHLPFTRKEFYALLLAPVSLQAGVVKARIMYDNSGCEISFERYIRRSVSKLIHLEDNTIDYRHKYTDRSRIDCLTKNLEPNTDVLIVKNGLLTDSSYCNIALYDGTKWLTPATPLLQGTQRRYLLENQIIFKQKIRLSEISNFHRIRLFNAMMPWHEATELNLADALCS